MGESTSDFSIVLPAHNEVANIPPMVAALKSIMAKVGPVEIIFVDDGSSDGTLAALRAAAADPAVRYVSFTRNFGHQAALRAGLHHARGRAVVIMDADFEHPPELIPELIAAWRSGAKVVVTQRIDKATQISAAKRFTSRREYSTG
jgi:polyisoprenyl-phosphate glycosyltransferase